MKPGSLTLGLVVLGLLAGCVTPGGDVAPQSALNTAAVQDGWWVNALPSTLTDEKHVHADRAMHRNITTPNFHVIGYDPLVTSEFNSTLTGQGCGGAATREDGRKLAIVHSISTSVSFVVADITDPAAPLYMGEFYLPNAVVWDADISADGNHVLIAANEKYGLFNAFNVLNGEPDVPVLPIPPASALRSMTPTDVSNPLVIKFRDCMGVEHDASPLNYAPGPAIIMVGIQDPEHPVFEDYVPQPYIGPHSVTSAMIDGTVYATSSVTNLVHEGSYYTFFEIADNRLNPLSIIETPGHPGVGFAALNGHTDVVLAKHPVTGQVLAHLANWDAYYVYDMTDPRMPVQVSTTLAEGSIHTTFPLPEMWGDKHYTIVGQEVSEPAELPSGWVYIVDTTDPANPIEVGRWTLPVKPKWDDGGLQFSPHYVAVQNHTMFVTNYHGGMWAVDISDPAAPAAVGIFVPERDSPAPYDGGQYGPSIEDVIYEPLTGILTTWDGAGGIYQLHFAEGMPSIRAPEFAGLNADE